MSGGSLPHGIVIPALRSATVVAHSRMCRWLGSLATLITASGASCCLRCRGWSEPEAFRKANPDWKLNRRLNPFARP